MEQVYLTGPAAPAAADTTPAPGRSLRLPAVRARSAGVGAEQLHAVLPHSFHTPPGAKLSLLNTPHGRVLTHAVPHADGFFAHTLLNVPDTADALLAVQTWGSPHWQRTPPDGQADLPELPYLPVADVLDDAGLKAWLANPYHRELTEFAFAALLGTGGQLFVAAPAESVAWVVYAAGRAFPAEFVDALTFSTSETDPPACPARVVGFDTTADGPDLPTGCYKAAALNTFTGKRTDLPAVPFAPFAADALARGEFAALDDLKATWQRLGVKEQAKFDLVFRLARGTGTLTKDEAAEALAHPPLAAWVSTRPDVQAQLLDWALADRAFAKGSFGRAVQSLRQKPEVLAKLAAAVRTAGEKAVADGGRERAGTAFEVLLPTVAPAKANAVWGELLTKTPDPAGLTWEMRWFLVPRFVRFAPASADFARWLDVPSDKLGELLALDLPRPHPLTAARAALRCEGASAVAGTLAKHPALALDLLKDADAEPLYAALLAHAPERGWFEAVIARASDYPADRLNGFFETSLTAGTLDADRLVRTQGDKLLELFAGRSGLDRLGSLFLAAPPADLLGNPNLLAFLDKLRAEAGVGEPVRERVEAVRAVRQYLDSPRFDADATAPVAAAFTLAPAVLPTGAKAAVFDAVAKELAVRVSTGGFLSDLENALAGFGGTLAADGTDLYENLLRDLRKRVPECGRRANAAEAFLAVALGAGRPGVVDPHGLDGHAFAVASDAAGLGGHKLLAELDKRTANWPKDARAKWGFLLAAVRPVSRWKRDAVCGLIGAAVMAVAAVAWKLMG